VRLDVPPTADSPTPEVPSGRVLRSLLPYLAEFPARVIFALLCLVLAKVAGVTLPILLKRLVDAFGQVPAPVVAPAGLLLAYGGLRFINTLFGELRDVVFGRVSERAQRRAALKVFRHLHELDLDFHLSRRTGGVARDIERGLEGISFLLRFALFNILPTLFELGMVAAILGSRYDLRYAAIALGAVIIYIAFSVAVTEWRTRFVVTANQLDSSANARAVDSLINFETVKYFGNEGYEADRYDESLQSWERAAGRNRLTLSALNTGQAFIIGASITVMMWWAASAVIAHRMTLGDLVLVNAYMVQLFVPLNVLGFVYREIRRALADIQRMFGLLGTAARVQDRPGARVLATPQAQSIRFEHVRFGYHPSREILHDVSFEVGAGKKIAVVGPSGAGKSTLARLLFRFYDVESGRICVGGDDLRDLTQASLRAHIGVVPQDTVLFNDTILYNIAYGRPGAPREAIERAVRLAHLEPFISRLPEGLDTRVGERGLKVSGGEKQRIAIARVLLKDPPILVLDEATSSLDSASEQAILGALRDAARSRTTLVIAHRLSTVTDADRILVLDQGRIVESGMHEELLAAEGTYAQLWNLQIREQPNEEAVAPL
jgi:ATP-binding cassette subfamily B protein